MVGEEPATAPPAIERLRRVPFERLLSRPPIGANHAAPNAPCNIFTTSGTTSAPKFVLHRQGAIASHAQQVARAFGFDAPGTLSLSILPLCGVFGFNQTLSTLAAGKPCVLVESYEIEEIARLIAQHRPTTMFGSDDMFARLLELVPGEQPFPSVKWVGYAGFNAALENIAEIAEPRGLILRGPYGMSEVQALYSLQPLDAPVAQRKKGGGMLSSPLRACPRARSGDRRAAGRRPARRAGMRRAVADGGLLRQREGDRRGDDRRTAMSAPATWPSSRPTAASPS